MTNAAAAAPPPPEPLTDPVLRELRRTIENIRALRAESKDDFEQARRAHEIIDDQLRRVMDGIYDQIREREIFLELSVTVAEAGDA